MSLLSWLGQKIGLKDSPFWSAWAGGGGWSGENVTPQRAMQLSAVNRAVRLTAETIATLPLNMYEDTDAGPRLARGGEADLLIRESPNDEQTPVEFWEQMVGCMELVGDGIAEKVKIGRRTVSLLPIDPTSCEVKRRVSGGLYYRWVDVKGRQRELDAPDVFHLKGFTLGGDRGMSTVRFGAAGMGLAIAAERTAGKLFKGGLRGSGFIEAGQILEEPDRERFRKILDQYVGSENADQIMILEAGMTYKQVNMSAQDAELLLTRKFQIEEIGRWFGMPPILLGHAVEGQTMWGSGVDSILQAWQTLGLRQRLIRIQAVIKKRLMTPEARAAGLYPKYNPDALLAVNSMSRAQVLANLVQNSLLTPDEGRELLERGKVPGGDRPLAQVNLVPLDMLGQSSDAAVAAKAAFRSWLGIEDQRRADPASQSD